MSSTCFSIVTACYNTEKYVRACVESILAQAYPRDQFELICIDDGSTDDSSNILRSFSGEEGFVLRRTTNQGLESACNLGISLARYERIVRVDADDLLDPHFLHIMDEAIHQQPDYDFYYCKDYVEYYGEFEQYRKSLPAFDPEEVFSRGDFFATGTVYKKTDIEAVGSYDVRVKNCGLENYSLILRLISKNKKGLAVPNASFSYRRHHSNMSLIHEQRIVEYGKQLLTTYGRVFRTNEFHPYNLKLQSS